MGPEGVELAWTVQDKKIRACTQRPGFGWTIERNVGEQRID